MNEKCTGIVRRFDDLGRITIPKEIRGRYGFVEGAPADIFTTADGVILKLYKPTGNDANKSRIAKDWLAKTKWAMEVVGARFSIEGGKTTCEVICNGKRRVGIAKWNPDDKYDPNIGMVYAYCRAAGCTIPNELL